jgi:hypothetical protein
MLLEAVYHGAVSFDVELMNCYGAFERSDEALFQMLPLEITQSHHAIAVCAVNQRLVFAI